MAKSKKVEKETRKLMESITDMVKRKGDKYKFKSKNKKAVKKIKRTCVHWIYRKNKEVPTVIHDPDRPGYWRCTICGESFPVRPLEFKVDKDTGKKINPYEIAANDMLALVNQMQFWSVRLGGDAEDTKMFLRLKENLPRFGRVSKQILKGVNRRQNYEKNREKSNLMDSFNAYQGFNYRATK